MRGAQAMLLATLLIGCGGPSAIAPSPCPASVETAEPPPGAYIDQRAVIDYDALVPPGDPRRNVDTAYVRQVLEDPMLLEQVYYDAAHGNQRAAWLVCELEATALSGGRRVARHVGSVRCRALGTCRAHWDELPISRDTASGQRLLSVLAAGFREEARQQGLENELIASALVVLVGARIAARARLGAPGPRPRAGRRHSSEAQPRSLGAAARGKGLSWSWKSKKTFGHTFDRHGAGAKKTRSLTGRAAQMRKPQGQWLDNQRAAEFLRGRRPYVKEPTQVKLPPDVPGQVIMPDGTIHRATKATLVPVPSGGYKTAYPIP